MISALTTSSIATRPWCSTTTPRLLARAQPLADASLEGQKNYAVNDQDFHWVICHELEHHGWTVIDVYLGNPMRHDEKYLLINQAFVGKQRLLPFFNRQNNDDLILAIQTAGVSRGRRSACL